uniref:Uncharacterized protein n=1 Tax=Neovison vison TaxID=452646 RepID=A0A8C7AI15_NEOVI
VGCQDNHTGIPRPYLEVLRIHMQLVTVQLTQLSKGVLEVIHMFNSISKGGQHLLAMGLDLGVAHYCRLRGQVAKTVEEPLGPWINNQEPMGCSQSQTRWEVRVGKKTDQYPSRNTFCLSFPLQSGKGRCKTRGWREKEKERRKKQI